MKNFNKNTSNFFYDLLTEEMGIIRNVQNDADVIGLKMSFFIYIHKPKHIIHYIG